MIGLGLEVMYQSCAPDVPRTLIHAIVAQESGSNPFAIGVVGGRLVRQPATVEEATATVKALEEGGHNYSVGLAQINKVNFTRTGLTAASMFEPCANLKAATIILKECATRANSKYSQQSLEPILSCYYSGSLDAPAANGYVASVMSRLAESGGSKGAGSAVAISLTPTPLKTTSAFKPETVSEEKASVAPVQVQKRVVQRTFADGDTGLSADKSSLVF